MPELEETRARTHTVIPMLTVKDGEKAIDFYKRAFGAEEVSRMLGPENKGIVHAELNIGDSVLFLSEELCEGSNRSPETLGGVTGGLYLSVPDVDAVYQKAIEAGAKEEMAVDDMFWGDRMGTLIDPSGHHWAIATHKEDVEPEEAKRRAKEFFEKMAAAKQEEVKASV